MVPSARRIDLGGPAELSHGHHQGLLQKSPLPEVFQQGREGVVEHGPKGVEGAQGGEGRLAMNVPRPGQVVEHVDRHEADAALHEPPGQEAALSESVHSVALPKPVRFAGQVEGLPGLPGGDDPVGLGEIGVQEPALGAVLLEIEEALVDESAEGNPSPGSNRRDVIGRPEVPDPKRRVGRVGVDDEGLVGLAQETGPLPLVQPVGQQDMRRQVPPGSLQIVDDATRMRVLDSGKRRPSGLHPGLGLGMGRIGVVAGADQRELVGVAGHAGEQLGDPDSGHVGGDRLVGSPDLGRSVRFRVPGVHLGRAPLQEQEDAVHVLVGGGPARGLELQEAGQRESQERQRAGMKEVPAVDCLAEIRRCRAVETKHRSGSQV